MPFIPREDANRLIIKLEYTIRECKKYPGELRSCKETFQLLYAESDYINSSNETVQKPPPFSESNYKYLKTIAPNKVSPQLFMIDQTTTDSPDSTNETVFKFPSSSDVYRTDVDLAMRTQKKGIYLVFRDQGACVSLLSIKVYYTLCSSQINNLVIYPKTPTGSNVTDLVQRAGHCIENAESKITPFAYCQANGI